MRACGAPAEFVRSISLGPEDGVDVDRAQGCDEDDRDALHAGRQAGKGRILDELCATTGWHRNHARKALGAALRPRIVAARCPRPPKYGPKVIAALIFCWAVLGMPAGKRLAPILGELVAVLRRFGELDIGEDTAALLAGMSAATIDRRLAPERKKHELKGRSRNQTGIAAQKPHPDPHLGRVGRRGARIRRDRPGQPRRWQRRRGACLDADRHRHRHRLDREPQRAQQGP
jgi:hypothetical protein